MRIYTLRGFESARRSHNQLGLAYQIAFIRLTGRTPGQQPFEILGGSDAGSSRENSYTWARRGEAGLVQQSRTSFVRHHLAPLTFQNSLDESNRKSFALVGCGLKRRRKNLHVHVQQDAETIVGTIDQRKAPIRRDQSFQLSFRRQTLMATHFAWGEGCHGSLHGIEGSDGPRTNTPFPSE